MYAFNYNRAETARKAVNLSGKLEDAKFLAGGQTLLPTMKQRLASPGGLIDLSGAADLKGIEMKGRNLVIGAMTRHADVANSELVREKFPALADLAGMIGDPAVRNRGTIGGSVANNDPAADYPSACLALNATIITNKRKILADQFFHRPVRDGAGGRRADHQDLVSAAQQGGLREVSQPSLALRHRRRVRRQEGQGRARHGDRRRLQRRLPRC